MKKIFSIGCIVVLCVMLLLPMTAAAASASATLTGPTTVRAGDTVTLTFKLGGNNLAGASGTLAFDSNQLTLTGTKQSIAAPWVVEFNGKNFVAYDNNLSAPINGSKGLFTATFKVKAVSPNTKITVSCTNVKASDGSADVDMGTVSYNVTVAAPLSGNAALSSLSAEGVSLSPTFSAGTVAYTASVPFGVSKLAVKATAADTKAKVSINSPTLTAGGTTTVTVTVKAENGATRVYTIKVKRAQDPQYKASGDNALASLTVDGYVLSPKFHADTTAYVVWLPYETTSVKVSGKAAHGKAQGVKVDGGDKLLAGQDNPITVTCTAEDGSQKTYTVIAKRAAAHDGTVEEKPPVSTPDTSDTPANTDTSAATPPTDGGLPWWALAVAAGGCLALGIGVGFILGKKKTAVR